MSTRVQSSSRVARSTARLKSRHELADPAPMAIEQEQEPPEIIWRDGVEYVRVRKGHLPLSRAARRARYKAGKCDECGEPVGAGGAAGQDGAGNPIRICRSCNDAYRSKAGL